jgi:Na+-translocating ferredoxin:NAD+ oxidoreductase subunit B
MNESSVEIYKKLREHLDKLPVGFPETESGIEMRILKYLFTPDQAEIALRLSFYPDNLKKLQRKLKKYSMEELEKRLDEMYFDGLINRGVRNENGKEVKYYTLAALAIGMYEYQLNRLTPEFFKDVEDYFDEGFLDEFNKTGIPQLRTIPIEQTVEHEQAIATYDDLKKVIETIGGPIAVAECICRKGTDMLGEPCKKTELRESCFSFRTAAKVYIEKGLGREISKEEALEILEKAQEDGLVLQPGNSQRPMNICTCCGCCCGVLSHQNKLEEPARFFATNYYAKVDPEECIGCGICEERCNMNAVHVEDDIAVVNLARCIGCGACVPACTSEAIKLYKKEDEITPPKNTVETYLAIMDKKAELARAEKNN